MMLLWLLERRSDSIAYLKQGVPERFGLSHLTLWPRHRSQADDTSFLASELSIMGDELRVYKGEEWECAS